MGKHNLSVGVVMMLINDGFIQEKDEEEAIDAVNDLLDDICRAPAGALQIST